MSVLFYLLLGLIFPLTLLSLPLPKATSSSNCTFIASASLPASAARIWKLILLECPDQQSFRRWSILIPRQERSSGCSRRWAISQQKHSLRLLIAFLLCYLALPAKWIIYQVFQALVYLHEEINVAHRDIKVSQTWAFCLSLDLFCLLPIRLRPVCHWHYTLFTRVSKSSLRTSYSVTLDRSRKYNWQISDKQRSQIVIFNLSKVRRKETPSLPALFLPHTHLLRLASSSDRYFELYGTRDSERLDPTFRLRRKNLGYLVDCELLVSPTWSPCMIDAFLLEIFTGSSPLFPSNWWSPFRANRFYLSIAIQQPQRFRQHCIRTYRVWRIWTKFDRTEVVFECHQWKCRITSNEIRKSWFRR